MQQATKGPIGPPASKDLLRRVMPWFVVLLGFTNTAITTAP